MSSEEKEIKRSEVIETLERMKGTAQFCLKLAAGDEDLEHTHKLQIESLEYAINSLKADEEKSIDCSIADYIRENYPDLLGIKYAVWRIGKSFEGLVNAISQGMAKIDWEETGEAIGKAQELWKEAEAISEEQEGEEEQEGKEKQEDEEDQEGEKDQEDQEDQKAAGVGEN